jgi:opacity protein-like surface antigen
MASGLQERRVRGNVHIMNTVLSHISRTALALLFVAGLARPASADWLLTPYLGVVFGGGANTVDIDTLDEAFEQRATFGGSLAGMSSGIWGFEVDFSYSPNFFQFTEGGEDFEFFNVDSSMTTLMGNLVVGIPVGGTTGGGVRPYLTGGVGLMRANINFDDLFDDLSTNETGFNVGAGVHVFFSDTIGLRGDVRYFRGFEQRDDDDPAEDDDFFDEDFGVEDFDYWRATLGITFRFGG